MVIDYFFNLSKVNDYIKMWVIVKNVVFLVKMLFGDLEIIINLLKFEKDFKVIVVVCN